MPEARVIPLEPREGRAARRATRPGAAPTAVPEPAAASTPPSDWERKLAGGLAFLRRRLTGDHVSAAEAADAVRAATGS